ncbi:MAG: sorbitol-6-phosphate dehydrogenase [Planctomycetes bacterium]|nr:sorbitol-6-phosphate dehydrogenase [Planctomycetota bacterium]
MVAKSSETLAEIPQEMWLWPLYGKGFENLGAGGKPVRAPVPGCGPDQLLVRLDAVGMCFSDIKIINLGPDHPRLSGRNMKKDPVVLGHEVAMTVVGVGESLRGRYHVGERYVLQADIVYRGVPMAYGYKIRGGMTQYGVVGPEVLNGDEGNYLIPIERDSTGYAQAALCEPWACVLAAYNLNYRSGLKAGGTAWFIGDGKSEGFTISQGFDRERHPGRAILTNVPSSFKSHLQSKVDAGAVQFEERNAAGIDAIQALAQELVAKVDDAVFLGAPAAEAAEAAIGALARWGVANIVSSQKAPLKARLDIGRVHYDNWVVVGTDQKDVAAGYRYGVRSALAERGTSWFVGAAGPMGRMHVQRAIELKDGPRLIVATDVSTPRLEHLQRTFQAEAKTRGVEMVCLNPQEMGPDAFEKRLRSLLAGGDGFDDIVVLVPAPAVIADASRYLGTSGVMNVFAGVARGVKAEIDLAPCCGRMQTRIIGSSASSIDDLKRMLHETESGLLSTNRSVAAVGGILSVREGYQAVASGTFPGKVVIYPQLEDFPLTPVEDLPRKSKEVGNRLRNDVWNVEAEKAFMAAGERSRPEEPRRGELAGKRAFITGAAQGLGRYLAERLIQEGAWVTLVDIKEEAVCAAALELEARHQRRVRFARADVTSEAEMAQVVEDLLEEQGQLDVLVANAGVLFSAEVTEMPLEKWRQVIDVNLTGYFVCAQAAARAMKAQKRGAIIQINSKSGKKGSLHNSAYAASKFGGLGLTQSLALDLAPYGVRVNAVCPGNLLDSPLWKDNLYGAYARKWGLTVEEVRRKYTEQVPLGRGCEYEDVGNVVVFLASEKAAYMTGQAINVTGGQEMR